MASNDDTEAPARGRGRPRKALDFRTFEWVVRLLRTPGSFAEVCKRAGTSAYVVRREMKENPWADFCIRAECLIAADKRKLSEDGADPEIVAEAAFEAELWLRKGVRRTWEEVQAAIAKRRDDRAWCADSIENALRSPVPDLPPARTPEEECF